MELDKIYFDNNATTPLDKRVLDAMLPFLTDNFANASSTHHFGLKANEAVKNARVQVADLIGAEENEIIFTSGSTEAINIALKVGLIMILTEHGYPPVPRDEVFKEIFEQAENFKKYSKE